MSPPGHQALGEFAFEGSLGAAVVVGDEEMVKRVREYLYSKQYRPVGGRICTGPAGRGVVNVAFTSAQNAASRSTEDAFAINQRARVPSVPPSGRS